MNTILITESLLCEPTKKFVNWEFYFKTVTGSTAPNSRVPLNGASSLQHSSPCFIAQLAEK